MGVLLSDLGDCGDMGEIRLYLVRGGFSNVSNVWRRGVVARVIDAVSIIGDHREWAAVPMIVASYTARYAINLIF